MDSIYKPLEKSQIEFLSDKLDSLTDGQLYDSDSSDDGILEDTPTLEQSHKTMEGTDKHLIMEDKAILNKRMSSTFNEEETISFPSIIKGSRKKIILHLSPAEIRMIRHSWYMFVIRNTDKFHDFNNSTSENGAPAVFKSSSDSKTDVSNAQEYPYSLLSSGYFAADEFSFFDQFYNTLIEISPFLDDDYPTLKHQASGFAIVLNNAVSNLEDPSKLDDYMRNLGKRHSRILGIEAPNFEIMGVSFLKTFHDYLGKDYTLELGKAWSKVYFYLANNMLYFGIDPVLRDGSQEDIFVFPVPNFISGTTNTVTPTQSRVKSSGENAYENSYLSYNNSTMSGSKTQRKENTSISAQTRGNFMGYDIRPLNSNATGKRIPTVSVVSRVSNKKYLTKKGSSNKKECILM